MTHERAQSRAALLRRRQRGAALVEAAFMLPMFVILFFASLYAHNLGYTYMNMNRASRANAWAYSMSNCGDSADDDSEVLPTVDSSGEAGGAIKVSPMTPGSSSFSASNPLGDLEGIAAGVGSVFPDANGAQSTNTKELNWRVPNLYAHSTASDTTTVTQSVTVNCNNAPKDGGAVNTLKLLGQTLASALQ